jgi:hypothetical protein
MNSGVQDMLAEVIDERIECSIYMLAAESGL